MKDFIKLITFLLCCFLLVFITGCDEDEHERLFGETKVYMPQANLSGDGSNIYLVPSDTSIIIKNYEIDTVNKEVNIFLGVVRSGTDFNEELSISLVENGELIENMIDDGDLTFEPDQEKKVYLLADNCYSLPDKVNLLKGENSTTFSLSIKFNCLKVYASRKLAIAVSLNPDRNVEIVEGMSETIILINPSEFNLP